MECSFLLYYKYLPSSGYGTYSSGNRLYFLAASARSFSVSGYLSGWKSLFQSKNHKIVSLIEISKKSLLSKTLLEIRWFLNNYYVNDMSIKKNVLKN